MDAVEGTDAKIRDTRKTLPGLRALQKYAVRVGGGVNHRMGLGDAALIKDNHVAAAGSVVAALRAVRAAAPGSAVRGRGRHPRATRRGARRGRGAGPAGQLPGVADADRGAAPRRPRARRCKLESSGGLSLDTAADYAGTGVDYLAVGALTHSVRVLDIGLDL